MEIIVVTHGGFVHFFYDRWAGVPGDSGSGGDQLDTAEALPMILPGSQREDGRFHRCPLDVNPGPYEHLTYETVSDLADVSRDCGIFTPTHFC